LSKGHRKNKKNLKRGNLRGKARSKFATAFNILYIFILLASLAVKLLWTWLTLYWRCWKIRRIFERELIKQGMPKKSARELSAQITAFKKKFLKTMLKLS